MIDEMHDRLVRCAWRGANLKLVLMYWATRYGKSSLLITTVLLAWGALAGITAFFPPVFPMGTLQDYLSSHRLQLLSLVWFAWCFSFLLLWLAAFVSATSTLLGRLLVRPAAESGRTAPPAPEGNDAARCCHRSAAVEVLRECRDDLERLAATRMLIPVIASWSGICWHFRIQALLASTFALGLLAFAWPGVSLLVTRTAVGGVLGAGYAAMVALWATSTLIMFALFWLPALRASLEAFQAWRRHRP